ncbi:MAG: hypothetical protein EOP22_08450 [Hyphomicrobiales bacterium]|nr:MAG: hypothetical protein EOP22_08450 [Hyphomicrobiales bacterium]
MRYRKDFVSFVKAYALSTLAVLPMTIYVFGIYALFVWLYLGLIGLVSILLFTALTALLGSRLYKFAIYLLAVAVSFIALRNTLVYDPAAVSPQARNTNALLFMQVTFGLGLFYILIERPSLSGWIRGSLDGVETQET